MTSGEDNQENIPLRTDHEPETTNLKKSSNSIDSSGQNSGNKSKLNGALSLFAILFWGLAGYAVFLQLKVLRQANQLISQELNGDQQVFISSDPPTVRMGSGTMVGQKAKNGAIEFLGVAYAYPPQDSLRLRPPKSHHLWSNDFSRQYLATKKKSGCLSGVENLFQTQFGMDLNNEDRSEDCLFMNMWLPSSIGKKSKEEKPVLVFVHGGSFIGGNASRTETDGAKLAEKHDIIVVSVQYRLGIYGFGYPGRIRSENIGHYEQGNFAMMDIRLALKTVHENIHRFGGDKNKITLMGNSAGALAVGTILSDEAPEYSRSNGWPFYRSAILQCPPVNLKMRSPEDLKDYNEKIITASGCNSLKCFQELSTDQVGEAITKVTDPMLFDLTVNSIFGTPFGPIEDNITVFNPNKNSIQQNAPVVIGINADEPVPFLNMIFNSRPLSKVMYAGAVKLLFGDLAPQILNFYPITEDNRDNLVKIEQDAIFNCGNKRLLKETKVKESYMYVFHQKAPKSYNHWSKDYEWGSCEDHACHCTDTGYFFDQYNYDTEEQKAASEELQNSLISFIKDGQTDLPRSNHGENVYHFRDQNKIVTNDSAEICRFWDKVKNRSDLCELGDETKCFSNWPAIFQAVGQLKSKVGI